MKRRRREHGARPAISPSNGCGERWHDAAGKLWHVCRRHRAGACVCPCGVRRVRPAVAS